MRYIDTILYDLDGTIVDSNELILSSFRHTFDTHFPKLPLSRSDLLIMMGPPLRETFARFTNDSTLISTMVDTYLNYYKTNEFSVISLFKGMKEAIQTFHQKGYKQAIITTKFTASAQPSIQHFGLDPFLDMMISLDDVSAPKPHPEGIILAMEKLSSLGAVMVGDNATDIEAGKNAHILTVGVRYSLKYDELVLANPDVWIEDGFELIQYINKLNKEE